MLIYKLFLIPILIFSTGSILRDYDYKYYDTHPKYLSQNGINLSFIKLSDDQWEYFLKKLSFKYHSILAISSLILNIILYIITNNNENIIWIEFGFFFISEILLFFYMYKVTRKKIN